MKNDQKNAGKISPLYWRVQPIGAIIIVMCGFGLAYAMDHARTPHVQIRMSPERDITPGEVRLRVSTDMISPVETIAWDFDGDGIFDAEGPDLHSPTHTFSTAGKFIPRVVVTDRQGHSYEAVAQIMIENAEDLQSKLNARWKGMLAALGKKDIEEALRFVSSNRREVMRHDWTVLKDHLAEIENLFSVPLQLTDGRGYRVVAKSAEPLPMGETQFPLEVQFVWESDGEWHIKSY